MLSDFAVLSFGLGQNSMLLNFEWFHSLSTLSFFQICTLFFESYQRKFTWFYIYNFPFLRIKRNTSAVLHIVKFCLSEIGKSLHMKVFEPFVHIGTCIGATIWTLISTLNMVVKNCKESSRNIWNICCRRNWNQHLPHSLNIHILNGLPKLWHKATSAFLYVTQFSLPWFYIYIDDPL